MIKLVDIIFGDHKKNCKMKSALVTGASDGIGFEVARLLAKKGYTITAVARSEDKLKKLVQSLANGNHNFILADLSLKDDLQKVVEDITVHQYNVLINNAGVGKYGEFVAMDLDEQLQIIQLNVNAVVTLSFHFLKRSKQGDALINTGSMLGIGSFPGSAVYAATKAFVTTFSESLWYEAKKKGVFVTGFNPGPVKTGFHLHAGGNENSFPNMIMETQEQVAKEMVRALEKRNKPRTVPGALIRFLLFSQRFISRKSVVLIMSRFSSKL
jgi:short-subunit dehydrogenase